VKCRTGETADRHNSQICCRSVLYKTNQRDRRPASWADVTTVSVGPARCLSRPSRCYRGGERDNPNPRGGLEHELIRV
jgi:hypothetical protein